MLHCFRNKDTALGRKHRRKYRELGHWASWAMHVKIHLIHASRAAKCVLKEPSSLKKTTNKQEELAAISVPI